MSREGVTNLTMSFLLLLLHASCTVAHVALTYPPAAYPQYDFLDNVRTGAPCGLPMGQYNYTNRTTLVRGSQLNVTFHLAYAHRGGFQFDLLSCNGSKQLANLTAGFVTDVSSTETAWTVKVPDLTCDCCYFRLMREAKEWTGPASWGSRYLFWSCAPVQIVASASSSCDGTGCLGHGLCINGTCQCNGMWYGKYCQYRDGCRSNTDCNGHGQCVDLQSTSPPAHQCFCDAGWHGPMCNKQSNLTDAMFNGKDYSGYIKAEETLEYFFQYHSDTKELEVAIKYTGNEVWVAFGFRPSGLDGSCRATAPGFFPISASVIAPEGEGENTAAGEGEGENTAVGEGEGQTNAEGEGENNAEGEGENNAEGEDGTGSLHAMDCTDIVIAKVKGNRHRILDFYTRGRSTPQEDEWYGGQQSITAAVGKHDNGVTYVRFRKQARSGDKFDHDVTDSVVNVIWAHGQVVDHYMPTIPPPAAGISKSSFISDFYRMRELKYHGLIGRGSTRKNFVNPASPGVISQCNYQVADGNIMYSATWGPSSSDASKIVFALEVTGEPSTWVGIGFSNDRQMPASDIITSTFSNSNPVKVEDRWASIKARPAIDDDQSQIQDSSGRVENGKLYVTFKRTVATTDSMDLSLDQPRYFLFAWGQVNSGDIQYHGTNRYISDDRISPTLCASMKDQRSGSSDGSGGKGSGGGLEDGEKWGIAVACVVVVLAVTLAFAYYVYSRYKKGGYTKNQFEDQPFDAPGQVKVPK